MWSWVALTKNSRFNKVLVGSIGHYTAHMLRLFAAFEQFGKLASAPQITGRDSEKLVHNLTRSFTPNKVLLLKPEEYSKSYIDFRILEYYTNHGFHKFWDLWKYSSNCEQVSF